jgi:hypothetical protein
MKSVFMIVGVAGFVLSSTLVTQAQELPPEVAAKLKDISGSLAAVGTINNQTAVGCNICFTCGGDWPVFAGAWNSANFAAVERGPGCSGELSTAFDDRAPFLCCR